MTHRGTVINEMGNRYGRLTVIGRAPTPEGKRGAYWRCHCDCGQYIVTSGNRLRMGATRTCGCSRGQHLVKDETGNVYGRLTILKRAPAPKGSQRVHWLCECECGNQKTVSGCDLRRGAVRSCGCLLKEQPANTLPDGEAAFRRMYYQYRKSADKRGLRFELTEDCFRNLTKQPCHYCGQEPSNAWASHHDTGDYICNGIDRKDNDLGYVPDNCVPCCKQCNYFKIDMDYEAFIRYLDRVAAFRSLSRC